MDIGLEALKRGAMYAIRSFDEEELQCLCSAQKLRHKGFIFECVDLCEGERDGVGRVVVTTVFATFKGLDVGFIQYPYNECFANHCTNSGPFAEDFKWVELKGMDRVIADVFRWEDEV